MKKKILIFLYIFIFVIPALYEGCVPSKPTEEIEVMPSDRLIKKLEANRRKIKNFEGSGSININTPQMNNSASFKVILQKPDSVYLELYGPFGIDLAKALVTNDNFAFCDIMHNTVYKGRSDSDALRKIFKIDLSFGELMDAFTGAVNLTSRLSQDPSNYEIVYDKYVLTYLDSLTSQKHKYTIDVRDLVITDYQMLSRNDQLIMEGVYSKFKVLEGIAIPYNTDLSLKRDNQSLKVEYRRIDVNKKNVKITMSIPDDAQVVEW